MSTLCKCLVLAPLVLLSVCAQAQEGFTLAGRLDVPSIMKLCEKAGKLADKAEPGSSGKIVLATVGVTMNPQLADFDLSMPFSLLVYSDASQGKGAEPWSVCAIVAKKRKKVPQMVKFGSFELHVADFGERAALCASKSLAERLKTEPESPSGMAKGTDLSLWLNVPLVVKEAQASSLLMASLYVPDAQGEPPGEAALDRLKTAKIRLQYLDKLLNQFSELSLSASLFDEKAQVDLLVKPQSGSGFEAFIAAQRPSAKLPDNFVPQGFDTVGLVRINPGTELKSQISAMFKECAIETSSDERRAAAYAGILEAAFEAATGEAAACVKTGAGAESSKFILKCAPESMAKMEEALQKSPDMRTEIPGLWLLNSWDSGKLRLYCVLRKGEDCGVAFLFGKEEPAEAQRIILASGKIPFQIEVPEGAAALFAKAPKDAEAKPGAKVDPFCAASFANGMMKLTVTAGVDDFKESIDGLQDSIPAK